MNNKNIFIVAAALVAFVIVPDSFGQSGTWQQMYQLIGGCAPNEGGPPIIEFAASNDGHLFFSDPGSLYKSSDDGITWERPGFQLFHIEGILPMGPDTLLIALYSSEAGVYEVTSGGEAWTRTDITVNMTSLTATKDRSVIFANPIDEGLYVSHDRGASWTNVLPDWQVQSVRVGPDGRAYLSGPGMYVSDDGITWNEIQSTRFPFPTDDQETFLATDSDGVYRSTDAGLDWSLVLESDRPALLHNSDGNLLAISKEGQVNRSIDNGISWTQIISEIPAYCGLRSSVTIDADDYLWLGNSVGVIYKSTLSTAVAITKLETPMDFGLLQSYPNPSTSEITIQFELGDAANMDLIVFDLLGREVATLASGFRVNMRSHGPLLIPGVGPTSFDFSREAVRPPDS